MEPAIPGAGAPRLILNRDRFRRVSVSIGLGQASRKLAGNATSFTFTTADLAGVTNGASVFLFVSAYKYSNSLIGGKHVFFEKERDIFANVVVVDRTFTTRIRKRINAKLNARVHSTPAVGL